jgi:hypothetical protein
MKISKLAVGTFLSLTLFTSGVVLGENVSERRHPNLAEAQRFIEQAIERVSAAQGANEFDMGGHAAKAKDHLDQAYREIKLAAKEANRH